MRDGARIAIERCDDQHDCDGNCTRPTWDQTSQHFKRPLGAAQPTQTSGRARHGSWVSVRPPIR